ncbi:MAG: TetR/AcrR family transcriptional regulator [Solirubrobacteraceae bacterium]
MDPPSRTTAPGRQRFTDEALLDAAAKVFHARGYHAAQMTDLAAAAGTTKPTLYARMGSKQELYISVLEREARLLTAFLYSSYEQAANRPLSEMIEISMLAFFRYAQDRRAGFELLFRGEPSAPGQEIGERAMQQVTEEIAKLFGAFNVRSGRRDRPSDALLAAAGVSVARQVCQYALDNGYDLDAAGALASSFAEAGLRGVDSSLLGQMP